MKNILFTLGLTCLLALGGCSRVEPNQAGVLMENYGKNGKEDFTIVSGKVWTTAPGTELYTIPLFEQRGQFSGQVSLKSADGTEFVIQPTYSYKVIKNRAVDVIFDNKQILKGDAESMQSIQSNILNPKIVDLLRSEVLKQPSTALMEAGGNEKFNELARKIITEEFNKRGFELISFSAMLDYSQKVKSIIDERNQSNTQIDTIDSKIKQAQKELELTRIQTEINLERSRGLTPTILQERFIAKWDGKTPLYGNADVSLLVQGK